MLKLATFKELFHKILRFGPLISFGNIIVTYGNKLLPRKVVKAVANNRNKAIQKYLSTFVNDSLQNYCSAPKISYDKTTAPIWTCWLQGEECMPDIVRVCVESIKKYSGHHPVIVVSLNNYTKYVNIAPHIVEKYSRGFIKHCHFTDILRINLLAQQGGLWMDATMFCTKPIDGRFFNSEFHTIKLQPFGNFVSQCRWAVYCLSTRPGNKLFVLLQGLFEQYLEKECYFVDYFMFDQFIAMLYEQDSDIRKMIDDVPFTNQDIMKLTRILNEKFDDDIWRKLTDSTAIFKLSWKVDITHSDNATYYSHLTSHITRL
jgi:hypothetical protein